MKTFKTLALTILGICASAGSAYAQLNATNAFASAPQSVFPLLDKNARLDMIDYFASGSDTPSRNKLDGSSRISELNDYSVKIKMTDASDYQLAILPAGSDSLIAVISTVATPAHDSHISFYHRSRHKRLAERRRQKVARHGDKHGAVHVGRICLQSGDKIADPDQQSK